jgi:hypothetical protein
MFRVLLYLFLIYLGYQFIFNFVVPVYRATQKIKNGFREMNGHNDSKAGQSASSPQQDASSNTAKEKVGEYIDFEEVK